MDPANNKLKSVFDFMLPETHLNRSLRILITTNAILSFIVGMFAPFYAVFVVGIGGNIALAGIAWSISSIVGGTLILLFANWELKVKKPELLIALGYILRSGVFLSYAFMTSIPQLIATQILWGVASALGTPAFDAVYANHTTKEDSVAQWGGWEGVSAIATGAAAIVGGIVIEGFGYTTVFLLMAVISVSLGIYISRVPQGVL